MKATKNFKPREFKCPCCKKERMKQSFIDKLQKARDIAGFPFIIAPGGGWRCHNYQAELFERNPDAAEPGKSEHEFGEAADPTAQNSTARAIVVASLHKAGFERIGISTSRGYVHVGDKADKPRPSLWVY